jgi:hypothetical protein
VSGRGRQAAAAAIGLAVAIAAVVPFALWWRRFPDPMASHWGFVGGPDGSTSKAALAAILVGPSIVLGLAAAAMSLVSPASRPGRRRPSAALSAGLAALLAGASWSVALANRDARDWQAAGHVGLIASVGGLVVGAAVAATVTRLLRPAAGMAKVGDGAGTGPPPSSPATGPVGLQPGEVASWTGYARAPLWLPALLALLAALIAVEAVVSRSPAPLIGVVALAVAGVATAWIRVSIDWRGLRIRYGPLPWPVTKIPLDSVRQADRIDLNPREWGGWGYRGSRKLLGRAAVVLRAGDAIRLTLADSSVFAVTVNDAGTGVALLNELRGRQPAA